MSQLKSLSKKTISLFCHSFSVTFAALKVKTIQEFGNTIKYINAHVSIFTIDSISVDTLISNFNDRLR